MKCGRFIMAAVVLALAMVAGVEAKDWETDFEKASEQAKTSGRYMLLDFSGSDWCGWCIKLDKEVFSKKAYKEYAKDNLVCVLLDFPRRSPQGKKLKQQNEELMKKFSVKGFPSVIILSPAGELVGKTGYRDGGPEKYVDHLKEMIDEHKKKAAPAKQ